MTTEKVMWSSPQLTHFGAVENVTLKGFGSFDGMLLLAEGEAPISIGS